MGSGVFVLLCYVSALAVDIGWREGRVASDAPARCKVNFEPKAVTASRAGHTTEGWGFIRRRGRVSVKRNLKRYSPRGRPEAGRKGNVCSVGND